jgi:branched-subunit amino acid ABC-type transport system permease component
MPKRWSDPPLFFCLDGLALLIASCEPCLLMDFVNFLIQLLNSVQYGLLLFMLAAGLTLIFGIMGVVNLAHGSFYMLGAYLAYSLAALTQSLTMAILLGTLLLSLIHI